KAEDSIRDDLVTGVQTCALPIYPQSLQNVSVSYRLDGWAVFFLSVVVEYSAFALAYPPSAGASKFGNGWGDQSRIHYDPPRVRKIGRASCREGVCLSGVAVALAG